jgi:YihY family inner membrane protein
MNPIERAVRRADRFQSRHPVFAFPWAVVQKFGNDEAGALATRIAYSGLFSLFPLLLLFTTILGFVLDGHPDLRNRILDTALADFPIIGTQLRSNAHTLQGSGVALAVGIAGTIWGAFGVGQAAQAALNSVWNVPYERWPNFFLRRLRAMAAVVMFGLAAIVSTGMSVVVAHFGSGVEPILANLGSVAITTAVYVAVFMLLTAEGVGWRDVLLGAFLAAICWRVLQLLGQWYVGRLVRTSDAYGFFAIVLALLSFMYLASQLTLLAVEIDVVRKYRLWPRSVTQPPLTEGDRRAFGRLVRMAVRRPEYGAELVLHPSADEDPLEEEEGSDAGSGEPEEDAAQDAAGEGSAHDAAGEGAWTG